MRSSRAYLFYLLLGVSVLCPMCASFAVEVPGRTELATGWRLVSADKVSQSGAIVSQPDFNVEQWYPVKRMPATVLEILQEDGVYPNLYFGMNLLTEVPQDLYKQDWWYRTSFEVPAGQKSY